MKGKHQLATILLMFEDDSQLEEEPETVRELSEEEREAEELFELECRLKERKLELLRAQASYEEQNAIKTFVPHEKQKAFFENAHCKMRGVLSGNRFGKSTVGVLEDLSWCLGYRPWYPEGDPLRTLGIPQTRGVKILVIVQDWDKAREIFVEDELPGEQRGKFWVYMPNDAKVTTHRNRQNGVIDRIFISSKYKGRDRQSLIMFDTVKSWKTSKLGAESSDWDAIHIDEPVPRRLWEAHSRGLIDRGGSAWFLLTPLEEPWIFSEFNDNVSNPEWHLIRGSMKDNPTLDEGAIERYLSSLDEDSRRCRELGIPLEHGRLVYWTHIDESIQVRVEPPVGWKSWLEPPVAYTIRYAIDPHPAKPHAVLMVATAPTGESFFFHEIFDKCIFEALAKQIRRITDTLPVSDAICDPIAWVDNPSTGIHWASEMWKLGLPVRKASKSKTEGIIRTQEVLGIRPATLIFGKHLRRTLWELRNYAFNEKGKPKDEDDHMCENLYRLVINGLYFIPKDEDEEDPIPNRLYGESMLTFSNN